ESSYRTDEFGEFREDYRFTGKEDDVEVGLIYFGARYYAPLLGRWISADPLAVHSPGAADLNLFAYVHGRVFVAVDPVGLQEAPADQTAVRRTPQHAAAYGYDDIRVRNVVIALRDRGLLPAGLVNNLMRDRGANTVSFRIGENNEWNPADNSITVASDTFGDLRRASRGNSGGYDSAATSFQVFNAIRLFGHEGTHGFVDTNQDDVNLAGLVQGFEAIAAQGRLADGTTVPAEGVNYVANEGIAEESGYRIAETARARLRLEGIVNDINSGPRVVGSSVVVNLVNTINEYNIGVAQARPGYHLNDQGQQVQMDYAVLAPDDDLRANVGQHVLNNEVPVGFANNPALISGYLEVIRAVIDRQKKP
ncbi:MAG: RHS repeat-associated core domain-containing protein, partial [Polyangiaceae bacterium]|nr:RHS repeat-associated core domain-containing protein [Polyangiaceae bacterium]